MTATAEEGRHVCVAPTKDKEMIAHRPLSPTPGGDRGRVGDSVKKALLPGVRVKRGRQEAGQEQHDAEERSSHSEAYVCCVPQLHWKEQPGAVSRLERSGRRVTAEAATTASAIMPGQGSLSEAKSADPGENRIKKKLDRPQGQAVAAQWSTAQPRRHKN